MPDDDEDARNRQAKRTASGSRGKIRYGMSGPGYSSGWANAFRQQYRDFSNVFGIKRGYARDDKRSIPRNGSR